MLSPAVLRRSRLFSSLTAENGPRLDPFVYLCLLLIANLLIYFGTRLGP